jgi:hypothetical protein
MSRNNWLQLACIVLGVLGFAIHKDGSAWLAAGVVIGALPPNK